MSKQRFPRVEVEWWDAGGIAGGKEAWLPLADALAVLNKGAFVVVTTRGFLLKKTKDFLVVAGTLAQFTDGTVHVGDVNYLPRGMVKRIRNVK